MPWMKWLPWRFLIRRAARAHGFLDPMTVLARMHRFGQPSEVTEPIELLRSGVVFHARGLINSRIIQHNLDWVWPFWVERQFDPHDDAFVPRAFSITHINLTHRNWTAVGLPDCDQLPVIDPRGLLTPLFDGWSLDAWIVGDDGRMLLPSRALHADQTLDLQGGLAVKTTVQKDGMVIDLRADVQEVEGYATCRLEIAAVSDRPGWVALALRPYNPEGISFVHDVSLASDRRAWQVDDAVTVRFSEPPERHHVSDYHSGDVLLHVQDRVDEEVGHCRLGMATAAAMFRLEAGVVRRVSAMTALGAAPRDAEPWHRALEGICRLEVADRRIQYLFDAALRALVLHSPGDVYPGPYTYKRFWFRDSAFIVYALVCAGLRRRAERALDRFLPRQTALGYFHSQEGEWDSNGEALWILWRYCRMHHIVPKPSWREAVVRGARWIIRKRVSDKVDAPHAGLLPAGFSAEHLGPNDHYFWDNFWGIAGLEAAAALCDLSDDERRRHEFARAAKSYRNTVDSALARAAERLGRPAMPASPYRRLDAGAIGSIAAGYPLQLFEANDPRLTDTAEFLLRNCFVNGGFFQDMIHSGINPYLTLHIAQLLLRAGDARAGMLMMRTAELASPTGQWPEAIHPRTLGGCMGDGQHVWAAAEWFLMVRNCFLREEGNRLVLGAGVPLEWAAGGLPARFGPAPTDFGPVRVSIAFDNADSPGAEIHWDASWHSKPDDVEIRVPGFQAMTASPDAGSAFLVPIRS